MSFTGELAHLPIVDVIQLIYSTRKSGTLSVKSAKGESHLVFSDGYLVSANHLNNSVRIGQILVENNHLTKESLYQALFEQKKAGAARKPLIATLIEQGLINREDAYKSLEALIEMTIVEILTWTTGTFSLDVDKTEISDEYRYFPEILQEEILMNAQGILMDALRIYDEKMHDGTLEDIFFSSTENGETGLSGGGAESPAITANLLGLDALDTLTKKIPDVFIGLKIDDLGEEHRRVISGALGPLPKGAQERLCLFLTQSTAPETAGGRTKPLASISLSVIVLSQEAFICHAIATICRNKGYSVFTTDDESSLDMIIEQSLARDLLPILIIDSPEFLGSARTVESLDLLLQQKLDLYPRVSILRMDASAPEECHLPPVLDEGSETLLRRPVPGSDADVFVEQMTGFLKTFSSLLDRSFGQPDRLATRRLRECITTLGRLSEPPEIARELLLFTSSLLERSMILVVGATDLTAEKGIGITAAKDAGPVGPLMFKIPLGQRSVFDTVIEKQKRYFGLSSDATLISRLYSVIPAPRSSKVLIMPLMLSGNVIALIYADFGQAPPSPVQLEHLDILSSFVDLVLDNSSYRKKFAHLTRIR